MLEIPNPSFKNLTTIRLGGTAIAELVLQSGKDLEKLPERLAHYGGKAFFIGRGSNLLVSDGELPLTIVRLMLNKDIEICGEEDGKVLVRVQAGAALNKVLGFCLKNGLSGLEGLAGIPGSAGGAAMMNAGSFGTCMADVIHSIQYCVKGSIFISKNKELKASYRKLELPFPSEDCLIMEIIFALTPMPINVIFEGMNLNFFKKKSRQPVTAWSGGCAFKNPAGKEPAGILLEKAGFRGKELGGMAFSKKHANFLINTGKGSSEAAFDLLQMAKEEVAKLFGISLEMELKLIP